MSDNSWPSRRTSQARRDTALNVSIYCDESCHMEHDHHRVMTLGAVWCATDKTKEITRRLKEIKARHGMAPGFETKWRKVSPSGTRLYLDLLDYFFDDDDLHFRALVVPDKSALEHVAFGQDHDTWYYKMLFDLLKVILSPDGAYRIYLDQKDTRSREKIKDLHRILANSLYDFSFDIVERVQAVRSDESELMQLADLLIGTVSYANRGLAGNAGKEALVRRMRERSGYSLTRTTLVRSEKVNLFIWRPTTSLAS